MYGLLFLVPKEKQKHHAAVQCGSRTICGVRFFSVSVERSRSKVLQTRTLRKAARAMARAGVHTALFPREFAYPALFEKYGIRAAEDGYLRRMTAGAVARRVLAEHGIRAAECHVALLGDHMSAELRKALMELALHVRYTLLSAGGGGGEICSVLRREYGVSVLRDPGQEQLGQANLLLTFGKTAPCGTAGSLWLPCGEVTEADGFENAAPAVRYGAPPEVEEALRVDCNRNALLSILLEMGALRANELEVMEILQNA